MTVNNRASSPLSQHVPSRASDSERTRALQARQVPSRAAEGARPQALPQPAPQDAFVQSRRAGRSLDFGGSFSIDTSVTLNPFPEGMPVNTAPTSGTLGFTDGPPILDLIGEGSPLADIFLAPGEANPQQGGAGATTPELGAQPGNQLELVTSQFKNDVPGSLRGLDDVAALGAGRPRNPLNPTASYVSLGELGSAISKMHSYLNEPNGLLNARNELVRLGAEGINNNTPLPEVGARLQQSLALATGMNASFANLVGQGSNPHMLEATDIYHIANQSPPVTPAPVTPAPVTPAPVTPAPVTPAPVTPTPAVPEFAIASGVNVGATPPAVDPNTMPPADPNTLLAFTPGPALNPAPVDPSLAAPFAPTELIPDTSAGVSDTNASGILGSDAGGLLAGLTLQQQHLINHGSQNHGDKELVKAILVGEQMLSPGGVFFPGGPNLNDGALTREELSESIASLNYLVQHGNSFDLRTRDSLWVTELGPGATDAQLRQYYTQVSNRLNFLASNFSAVAAQGGPAMVSSLPIGGNERMVDLGDIQKMNQANLLNSRPAQGVDVGQMFNQLQQQLVDSARQRNEIIEQSGGNGVATTTHNGRVYYAETDRRFGNELYTIFKDNRGDYIAKPFGADYPVLETVPGKEQ